MTSQPRLKIGSATPVDHQSMLSGTVAADSRGLLKIFQPRIAGLDPVDIMQRHRADFTRDIHRHGAILLRGLDITDVETFDAVVRSFSSEILEYNHKSTPRTKLGGGVYTSTEYPADQAIPLHNELSWTHQAPRYLSFCCLRPALRGGATPIADSRLVFRNLPSALRTKFAAHGISYVRNYHPEIDLPWQEVFHSNDRAEVESYCRTQAMSCEWLAADHLRTRQLCQAVVRHPQTGELSWFNQAHLFHYTRVGEADAQSLLSMFGKENLPRNTYLGNGDEITDEELAAIRSAYESATYRFSWQQGDVLVVDNLACAHARDSYVGERKVVVAMTDTVDCTAIAVHEGV